MVTGLIQKREGVLWERPEIIGGETEGNSDQ